MFPTSLCPALGVRVRAAVWQVHAVDGALCGGYFPECAAWTTVAQGDDDCGFVGRRSITIANV